MHNAPIHKIYNRARIDDRAVNELLGISKAIIADGIVDQKEAEFLQNWLIANSQVSDNPIVANLLKRIEEMLADEFLSSEESEELLQTLTQFTGGNLEVGELLKSTTLPLDHPPPSLVVAGSRFCLTGTFAFGSRRDCEKEIIKLGGAVGSLTKQTNYLVIGIYATDSWAHTSFGRKIEKAINMKEKGQEISIIGENHWLNFLDLPQFKA